MLALKDRDIAFSSQHYCETLNELHSATKVKYVGMFMRGFIMLHDDICISLHCPGHPALLELERAVTSLILPGPLTMCSPYIGCVFCFPT
jgi:hypothetical protein